MGELQNHLVFDIFYIGLFYFRKLREELEKRKNSTFPGPDFEVSFNLLSLEKKRLIGKTNLKHLFQTIDYIFQNIWTLPKHFFPIATAKIWNVTYGVAAVCGSSVSLHSFINVSPNPDFQSSLLVVFNPSLPRIFLKTEK